jgi:citronellol/citronellal dehydrogenase
MHQINTRGTFVCSQACVPHLRKAANPHVLNLSPPLNIEQRWFAPHVAYTMAKFGMSMCTLAWAEEFRKDGIAANSLWPRTAIATAAIAMLGGEAMMKQSRRPEIMADAAHAILCKPSREFTGNFCIDDLVLHAAGVRDFSVYAAVPGATKFLPDFFVPADTPALPG